MDVGDWGRRAEVSAVGGTDKNQLFLDCGYRVRGAWTTDLNRITCFVVCEWGIGLHIIDVVNYSYYISLLIIDCVIDPSEGQKGHHIHIKYKSCWVYTALVVESKC